MIVLGSRERSVRMIAIKIYVFLLGYVTKMEIIDNSKPQMSPETSVYFI